MRKLLAGGMLALAAAASQAASYTGIYFFGDSLTDTGNVQITYAGIPASLKPPGSPAVVPGAPYDSEGRATNGDNYADVLATGLGFTNQASLAGGTNYAYGGARTRYQVFGPPFLGVIDQVAAYRAVSGAADPNALYVLWAGSNNLQDILLGRTTDVLGNPIPTPAQTLGDIQSMVMGLYAEGARHLLMPNVADLTKVPRLNTLPPAQQAMAAALLGGFNAGLDSLVTGLEAALPGLDIIEFDTYSALNGVLANPSAWGFTNTTDRCYTGDDTGFTGGGTVCANPDSYFFWDGIHPTAAAHQILGTMMLAAVVPEPSQGALLVLALAAIVATRRTVRRRAALPAA